VGEPRQWALRRIAAAYELNVGSFNTFRYVHILSDPIVEIDGKRTGFGTLSAVANVVLVSNAVASDKWNSS
jgi:hypothetical protein